MKSTRPRPPAHLEAATKKWFSQVASDYELQAHHTRLLTLACEAWDRGQQARQALADAGSLTYTDEHGSVRARPEIAIEKDSRIGFARLLRELALDVAPPPDSRPPRRPGTGR